MTHRLTEFCTTSGCGAKIGPGVLSEVTRSLPNYAAKELLVGFDTSDDACAYDLGDGRVMIQTVDFFPPMVDDPYTFGCIAAANALSDVWAMGGEPVTALNLLCFPTCLTLEQVRGILEGGHETAKRAGVVIAGGHSIEDASPKYGLCVTGFAEKEKLWRNAGAQPGDALVLTKPLGTGILFTAHKAEMLEKPDYDRLIETVTTLNREAKHLAEGQSVHACTDVTGFSLLGHSREMASAGGVTLHIRADAVPYQPAAPELARMGLIPAGAYNNRAFLESRVSVAGSIPLWLEDILYDPQTSGGLLLALPEKNAERLPYPVIGYVTEAGDHPVIVE